MSLNSKLVDTARYLRQNMTKTEKIVWALLRANQFGVKFRRQEPFVFGEYNFIADFYSPEIKLIIEIDGKIHLDKEVRQIDKEREEIFIDSGFSILRFKNKEVITNIKGVIKSIEKTVKELKK